MAKKRNVPDMDSRESPVFWNRMFSASAKRREHVNMEYGRYSRWFRGDLSDVIDPQTLEHERWRSSLENMTNLATVAALADLFFREPRFNVKPVYSGHPTFTAAFCRVEKTYLEHSLRVAEYRRKARRCLLDALLGELGVIKVTMDSDVVVDEELIEIARAEAREEILAFIQHGTEMKAREDQIHSIHIEVKEGLLAEAERGRIQIPRRAQRYIRKHLRVHEAMKGSERPTETIRSSRIRLERTNPWDYFYDPTVDDRADATWRGNRFLMRKQDVLSNEDYDRDARLTLMQATDRWESREHYPSIGTPGSFDVPDEMVVVYEVYDLVDQTRRLWADGGQRMLFEEERGELASVQPSGPYHELAFLEDPMEGQGIPPPSAFEGEQSAATHIAASHVAAAIQGRPRTMYDSSKFNADEAKKIWNSPVANLLPVKGLDPNSKLSDAFEAAPIPAISEQSMVVLGDLRSGVQQRSGLSVAKMGGGESAPTATGAALGAEASTSISDDRAASVDDWSQRTALDVARLNRRFGSKRDVVEVCGPEAIEAWPDRMAITDVRNVNGVEIVPGSTRRRNTAVDRQQLAEGIKLYASLPMAQSPSGTGVLVEMLRRYFDDGGMSGLDWSGVEMEAKLLLMMQQAQMGAGAPEEEGGEPSAGRAADEREGTSYNDIAQGTQNPTGGRVPTGASVGDKIRQERGEALTSVGNRA